MLWLIWPHRTAASARSVVNGPKRGTAEAAVVGELCLQTKCLTIIETEPLPIKDNLLDTSNFYELRCQIVIVDGTLDLAL